MATLMYKHLLRFAAIALLVGCASDLDTQNSNLAMPAPDDTVPAQPRAKMPVNPNDTASGAMTTPHYYNSDSVAGDYAHSPAVQAFIRQMVHKHQFSESYLNGLFSQAQRLESVIRLESPAPSTGKPRLGSWTRYRNKFLTDDHIANGVEFWRANASAIAKASATYHVDPEYIVGIIGVETYFGKNMGKTCIFDALTTLAFDTHRRGSYFASELENFLLMTREENYEPRELVGSWAGAMGFGQFMPSSFRHLAVDFNHDGHRDLWDSNDAIGSVAHYFSKNGWQASHPVTEMAAPSVDPSVIELSTYTGNEYWRVHPNFKVIKRYNNSNKYAMAVHQLAQAIKERYQG